MSIADDFIAAMAQLKAIEPDNDNPMRYSIWQAREAGYEAIKHALQQAHQCISIARLIQRDYNDELKARATAEKAKP